MRRTLKKIFLILAVVMMVTCALYPAYAQEGSDMPAASPAAENDGETTPDTEKAIPDTEKAIPDTEEAGEKFSEGTDEKNMQVRNAGDIAEYNGKYYTSLQDALDAAAEGGEVTLLKPVTLTDTVDIRYDKTDLNLNNHTLTLPDGKTGIRLRRTGSEPKIADVIIRNGKITGNEPSTWIDTFNATGLILRDLAFEDMGVSGGRNGIDLLRSDAVMEDCGVTGCHGSNSASAMIEVCSGTLTMNDCSVTDCSSIASAVNAGYQYNFNISPTLTMNGCRIADNSGTYTGGIESQGSGKDKQWWAIITLKDTVITGNSADNKSYSGGAMTLSKTKLRMSGGAIYGNHIPDDADATNSGADIYLYTGYENFFLPAPEDMSDGGADLKKYFWYDGINGKNYEGAVDFGRNVKLTNPMGLELRREPIKVVRNVRTKEEYLSLADAVAAAHAGDTLQFCAAENEGGSVVTEGTDVHIDKNLTIDLNGHHLTGSSSDGKVITVEQGKKLHIKGGRADDEDDEEANEINGTIDNLGDLEISGAVSFKRRILHRGSRLYMSGGHDDIKVSLDNGRYIDADPKLSMKKLEVFLLDPDEVAALNDRSHDHKDVLIVRGGSAALESVAVTPQIDNPHVRRVHKTGSGGEGLYLVDRIPAGIYVDGQNGDDSASGSEEAPVKTFEKALELLNEQIRDGKDPDGIYVKDTIDVTSEKNWSMPEGTALIRYEDNLHDLVRISGPGSLTLKDIVIDGLSEGGVTAKAPLVNVDGGTLKIGKGAVLRNNTNTSRSDLGTQPKTGGAVAGQNNALIVMTGGAVTDNEAGLGGGIGLYTGATLKMSGGEISRNRALDDYHGAESHAAGGGVFLGGGTKMDLSGGKISQNTSDLYGGGISLGGYTFNTISTDKSKKAVLNMTGGEIDGNNGRGNGGGIYIQANTEANISAGTISNNRAGGRKNALFGGGGIYVNSNAKQSFLDYGQLNISNVLITDNTARESGGGIGACPTSLTMVYVSSGSAIFENDAPTAHDILIDAKTGTNIFGLRSDHVAYISHYMLGGGEARWLRDGTELYPGPEGNHELMGHNHLTTHTSLELQSDPSEADKEKARSLAKVIITGNYSGSRGGGIGNNGNVRIGKRWDISAKKVWNDTDDKYGERPDHVTVRLKASVVYKGKTVEIPAGDITGDTSVDLSDGNKWKHTWESLPEVVPDEVIEKFPEMDKYRYLEITYGVEEVYVPDDYVSSVSGNMFIGYEIENTHRSETMSIAVIKKWDDRGHEAARPEEITVRLHDGHGERTLVLSEENGWRGRFDELPVHRDGEEIVYSLSEDHVSNYVDVIDYDSENKAFTVTNRYAPGKREVTVVKDWFDTGRAKRRPESITAELYADGVSTGKTLKLTEKGRWIGHFMDLPEKKGGRMIEYTVIEKDVPEDYDCMIEGDQDVAFTLINTYGPHKPDEPGKPDGPGTPGGTGTGGRRSDTGDANVSVYLLAAVELLSLALLALIIGSRRKSRGPKRGD